MMLRKWRQEGSNIDDMVTVDGKLEGILEVRRSDFRWKD